MITPKVGKHSGEFTKPVRDLIYSRDQGRCVKCGLSGEFQYHHRKPRGAGGTSDPLIGLPANGILLHAHCHEQVERNRFLARINGFLINRNGIETPDSVPIHHAAWGWVRLNNEGGWESTKESLGR